MALDKLFSDDDLRELAEVVSFGDRKLIDLIRYLRSLRQCGIEGTQHGRWEHLYRAIELNDDIASSVLYLELDALHLLRDGRPNWTAIKEYSQQSLKSELAARRREIA